VDFRTFTALRDAAAAERIAIVVRGDCMEPHLPAGKPVEVRARRVYLPGDVIVFRTRTGPLAIHRVLGWRPAGLVTRGDHCAAHDAPVPREAIVGAVCGHVAAIDRLRALMNLARIIGRRVTR
jgi:signal peptidase I